MCGIQQHKAIGSTQLCSWNKAPAFPRASLPGGKHLLHGLSSHEATQRTLCLKNMLKLAAFTPVCLENRMGSLSLQADSPQGALG